MCASRVSTCMRGVWYRDLDVEEHQELSGYAQDADVIYLLILNRMGIQTYVRNF